MRNNRTYMRVSFSPGLGAQAKAPSTCPSPGIVEVPICLELSLCWMVAIGRPFVQDSTCSPLFCQPGSLKVPDGELFVVPEGYHKRKPMPKPKLQLL